MANLICIVSIWARPNLQSSMASSAWARHARLRLTRGPNGRSWGDPARLAVRASPDRPRIAFPTRIPENWRGLKRAKRCTLARDVSMWSSAPKGGSRAAPSVRRRSSRARRRGGRGPNSGITTHAIRYHKGVARISRKVKWVAMLGELGRFDLELGRVVLGGSI